MRPSFKCHNLSFQFKNKSQPSSKSKLVANRKNKQFWVRKWCPKRKAVRALSLGQRWPGGPVHPSGQSANQSHLQWNYKLDNNESVHHQEQRPCITKNCWPTSRKKQNILLRILASMFTGILACKSLSLWSLSGFGIRVTLAS